MLTKKEFKDIQSLDQKKARDAQGRFLAEGPKIVSELAQVVPQQIQRIYAVEAWAAAHGHLKKWIEIVSEAHLQRLSHSKTPNQVVALLQQWPQQEPQLGDEMALYLDTIQDPGNLGTLLRIADWFGLKHVVCTSGCADLYNGKVVQASMASMARVNVFYDADLSWIRKQTVPRFAATLDGKSTFSNAHTGILMIGNESKGLRPELLELATEKVTIARRGEAESLNAAVAAGILLAQLLN